MKILIKTWVGSYYQTYSGLFFVLLLIIFGVFRGHDHLIIAHLLVGEISNFLYLLILLVPYGLVTGIFSNRFLKNRKNSFINELIHLSSAQRFFLLLICFVLLLLPVLLYMSFLVIVAILSGKILQGLIITSVSFSFIFLFILVYNRQIVYPNEQSFGRRYFVYIPTQLNFFWLSIIIKHLILNRTFSVILTKILSFFLLLIVSIVISTIDNYHRFLAVAIFITVVSNAFISYEIHYFMNYKMAFFRSLPQPISKIWLNILIAMIIFVLPEIIYILKNYNEYVSIFSLIFFLLNGVSFLMICFVYLLKTGLDQKNFIIRFYFGFLFLIILILFDVPLVLLSIVFLILSYVIFKLYFYRYENVFIKS